MGSSSSSLSTSVSSVKTNKDPDKKKRTNKDPDKKKRTNKNPDKKKRTNKELRNWGELPPELISAILIRLSTIDILKNAQKVCKAWHSICKNPRMWQKIDMYNLGFSRHVRYDLEIMCRHGIDRSHGGLIEIDIRLFGTDELLNYIADRSSNLRCLRLHMCCLITGNGLVNAVTKLTFLEELEISYPCGKIDLKAIGYSCPLLKTLKLNYSTCNQGTEKDDEALAIAETMSELRHLELFGNRLTNIGLKAILDNCIHLEHLDLCRCFNIEFVGDLEKRCSEKIRYLRRPDDQPTSNISAEDCFTMLNLFHNECSERVCHNGFL